MIFIGFSNSMEIILHMWIKPANLLSLLPNQSKTFVARCINQSAKANHHWALPVGHDAKTSHVILTLSNVLIMSARSLKHVRARNCASRCPAALRPRFPRRAVSRSFVAHFPIRFAQICTRLSSDQLVHSIVNNKTAVCKTEVRKSADFEIRSNSSTLKTLKILSTLDRN